MACELRSEASKTMSKSGYALFGVAMWGFMQGGRTPLHLAALQGHTGLVKLLEAAGADVRAKDEHGMTPLHKAAVQGHRETAAELLAHGAHVDAKLTVRSFPSLFNLICLQFPDLAS